MDEDGEIAVPFDPSLFSEPLGPASQYAGIASFDLVNNVSQSAVSASTSVTNAASSSSSSSSKICCLDRVKVNFYLNILFDAFMFLLSLVDVLTDFLVTASFYNAGHYTFFYISLALLLVAQTAYAALFTTIYTSSDRKDCYRFSVFCIVFPFSQVVPFLMMLQGYHFRWLDDLFLRLKLGKGEEPETLDEQTDPLRAYIFEKIRTLGGFLVESLVEAVPQSILQMIFIVLYPDNNDSYGLHIASVTISMLSVASKGILIAYSMHRLTFLFNIFCFVADTFSVFVSVAFIFFVNDSISVYSFPSFPSSQLSIFSYIWLFKELILGVAIIIFGLICSLVVLCEDLERPYTDYVTRPRWRVRVFKVLVFFFCCLLYAPFMIVVEAMKFSFFPLLIFNSMDSPYARSAKFYGPLFAWLRSEHKVVVRDDNEERVSERREEAKRLEKDYEHKMKLQACGLLSEDYKARLDELYSQSRSNISGFAYSYFRDSHFPYRDTRELFDCMETPSLCSTPSTRPLDSNLSLTSNYHRSSPASLAAAAAAASASDRRVGAFSTRLPSCSQEEFVEKLLFVNTYMAVKFLAIYPPRKSDSSMLPSQMQRMDMARDILKVWLVKDNERERKKLWSLRRIRQIAGYTLNAIVKSYLSVYKEERKKGLTVTGGFCCTRMKASAFFEFLAHLWFAYVNLPIYIISQLYSVVYPILCLLYFIAYSSSDAPWDYSNIQSVLSFIYIASLLLLLALAQPVWKWKELTAHFLSFQLSPYQNEWVQQMILLYNNWKYKAAVRKIFDDAYHRRKKDAADSSICFPSSLQNRISCCQPSDSFSASDPPPSPLSSRRTLSDADLSTASQQNSDFRGFPNELTAIIIDYLGVLNDDPTLRLELLLAMSITKLKELGVFKDAEEKAAFLTIEKPKTEAIVNATMPGSVRFSRYARRIGPPPSAASASASASAESKEKEMSGDEVKQVQQILNEELLEEKTPKPEKKTEGLDEKNDGLDEKDEEHKHSGMKTKTGKDDEEEKMEKRTPWMMVYTKDGIPIAPPLSPTWLTTSSVPNTSSDSAAMSQSLGPGTLHSPPLPSPSPGDAADESSPLVSLSSSATPLPFASASACSTSSASSAVPALSEVSADALSMDSIVQSLSMPLPMPPPVAASNRISVSNSSTSRVHFFTATDEDDHLHLHLHSYMAMLQPIPVDDYLQLRIVDTPEEEEQGEDAEQTGGANGRTSANSALESRRT